MKDWRVLMPLSHYTCLRQCYLLLPYAQVRLLLLTALCGEHLLLLGPPGKKPCRASSV